MIIKAEEARRRSLLHGKLKTIMDQIQVNIDHATENGRYETPIYVSDEIDGYLLGVIRKELTSLGYEVEYRQSLEPLSTLTIHWEGEE